jgi:hypothetical protein
LEPTELDEVLADETRYRSVILTSGCLSLDSFSSALGADKRLPAPKPGLPSGTPSSVCSGLQGNDGARHENAELGLVERLKET